MADQTDLVLDYLKKGDEYIQNSDEENRMAVTAHSCFWLFNFLNVLTMVLFQHFVFGRLGKNYLSKLAVVGCFGQVVSCTSSIWRNDHHDASNIVAGCYIGCGVGAIASFFMNIVALHLFLVHKCRGSFELGPIKLGYIQLGTLVWAVVASLVVYSSVTKWEQNGFDTFSSYFGGCVLTWCASIANCAWSHHNYKINLNSSVVDRSSVTKFFVACFFLGTSFFVAVGTDYVTFFIALSGMAYSSLAIAASVAGEMDFMQEENDP